MNNLPSRLRRNYLQQATDRASLHEQRANTMAVEKIHLELSLQAALARIRELEGVVALQEQVIDGLQVKRKRRAVA